MMIRVETDNEVDEIIAIDPIAATDDSRQLHIRGWVRSGCVTIMRYSIFWMVSAGMLAYIGIIGVLYYRLGE